jgi:hypothetical protein
MKRLMIMAWMLIPLLAAAQQHFPAYGATTPTYVNGATFSTASGATAVMVPMPEEPAPPSESKSLKFSFTTQDTVTTVNFAMGDLAETKSFDFIVDWGDTTAPQTLRMEIFQNIYHTYANKGFHTVLVEKISNESLDVTVIIEEVPLISFTIDSDCTALTYLRVGGCYLTESAVSDLVTSIPVRDESFPGSYFLAPQSESFLMVTESQSEELYLKNWLCEGGCYVAPPPPVEPKFLKFSFTTQDTVTVVTFLIDCAYSSNNFTFSIDWGDTTAPQTLTTENGYSVYTYQYEHPAAHTILFEKTSDEGFGIGITLFAQNITDFTPDGDNCTALDFLILSQSTLTTVPILTGCTELRGLSMNYCGYITSFPTFTGLSSLTDINISGCTSLTEANLTGYTALQNLSIQDCHINEAGLTSLIGTLPDRTGLSSGTYTITPQSEGYPLMPTESQDAALTAKNWSCISGCYIPE